MSLAFSISVVTSSGIASPDALMPSTDFNWLVAMMMPLAVMNPDTTGCDNRLARNPSRKTPIAISIRPDSNAKMRAAAIKSGLPGGATALAAVSVISDITATGPTASARLVPNKA